MERKKRIGRIGEIRFILEALTRGLHVLNPEGEYGYDCVVECNGKMTKVQIKTTSGIDGKLCYTWQISTKSEGADVYAFHILNTDVFFMVYATDVLTRKSTFKIPFSKLHNHKLNNWDILK